MTSRIKEFREKAGLKQTELSEICRRVDSRIDPTMISRFENNVCIPTPAVLEALASALNVPACALYSRTEQSYLAEVIDGVSPVEPQTPFVVEELVKAVGRGRDCPTDRKWLAHELDIPDRELRRRIAQARSYGYFIIATADGKGYFLSDDINDIERHYRTETKRAYSILSNLKACRRKLKEEHRL